MLCGIRYALQVLKDDRGIGVVSDIDPGGSHWAYYHLQEEQLVKQMMEKQGITEKLKRQDNMEWTRRMNTICHDAEEMILTEMIYTKG